MKLALIAERSHRAIIEHCKEMSLGIIDESQAVIVENPLIEGSVGLPLINTCVGVQALLKNPNLMNRFLESHEFTGSHPASYLYGFMTPNGFGTLMEFSYDTRFMSGGVGPSVGMAKGTGLACSEDVRAAFQSLSGVEGTLAEFGYMGEVLIGVGADFSFCDIHFGHHTGAFSLYTELSKHAPQKTYELCLGGAEKPELHTDRISVCTLLSYPPFPYNMTSPTSIRAPLGSERHLFRFLIGNSEVAYAAACGNYLAEAKRRCRRTTENCSKYNTDLQFRVDYGVNDKFVLMGDKVKQWS